MGNFDRGFGFDFGSSIDDIVHAAREFGRKMKDMGPDMAPWFEGCGPHFGGPGFGSPNDRPNVYFYPPTNSYSAEDGSLVFQFALAGIEESAVSISFQGDYLVLDAKVRESDAEAASFYRRGFRPRNIDRQKYRVSAEDYAQDQAKAVFKNGVLTVTIPPKEPAGGTIRIEIVKEGN
jgi:HSP20 family molecular chaperone IbpA